MMAKSALSAPQETSSVSAQKPGRGVAPAGVLSVARVVAPYAPGEVLRGVPGYEHGDACRARAGEGLARDGACVGVDDEGGEAA